eukprot:m.138592 g.138592  ORF g.138592 m.138592 type:complete len:168 (-) comp15512_c0_seq1:221-724(-)
MSEEIVLHLHTQLEHLQHNQSRNESYLREKLMQLRKVRKELEHTILEALESGVEDDDADDDGADGIHSSDSSVAILSASSMNNSLVNHKSATADFKSTSTSPSTINKSKTSSSSIATTRQKKSRPHLTINTNIAQSATSRMKPGHRTPRSLLLQGPKSATDVRSTDV